MWIKLAWVYAALRDIRMIHQNLCPDNVILQALFDKIYTFLPLSVPQER